MSKDYDYTLSLVSLHSGNWLHFNLQGQHFAPNYTLNKGGKKYNAYTPELLNVLCYEFEAFDRSSNDTIMVSNENRAFILNDFCNWYDEGIRVFAENYQPALIGMINNNSEALALTLEDYLTNYKSSNFHSEVPKLNEFNVGLEVYVKKQIDFVIMPHNIKSRGFYAGFYTALMEFKSRYKILIDSVFEKLNDATPTTAPETITADWKPKQMELAHAIVMKYGHRMKPERGLKAELARYYGSIIGASPENDYKVFKDYLTPKNHTKDFQCKKLYKCHELNKQKAIEYLEKFPYPPENNNE